MSQPELRLAMWSGPRNISTAMMRSWGNRADTCVCDEPLYAHYLCATGLPHPGAKEVIACYETDWRRVVQWLTGPVPEGRLIFYQKHMAHHLLPGIDRDWLRHLTHCFLIRDPGEVLPSLIDFIPHPTIEDTGLPQQVGIFEEICRRGGHAPPVIDARDVLLDPRGVLSRLCERLGIVFDEAMLCWPAGRRVTDGVWAKHWYASVERSTGFAPYRPREQTVPAGLRALHEFCLEYYQRLYEHRITA